MRNHFGLTRMLKDLEAYSIRGVTQKVRKYAREPHPIFSPPSTVDQWITAWDSYSTPTVELRDGCVASERPILLVERVETGAVGGKSFGKDDARAGIFIKEKLPAKKTLDAAKERGSAAQRSLYTWMMGELMWSVGNLPRCELRPDSKAKDTKIVTVFLDIYGVRLLRNQWPNVSLLNGTLVPQGLRA